MCQKFTAVACLMYETDAAWYPPTKEGEYSSSSIVFVCVPTLLPTSSHNQWHLILQLMIFIHVENSSSALTHLKYFRKLTVASNNWTFEVPQVWNGNKKKMERHLCIILLKEWRTIFFYLDQLSMIGFWPGVHIIRVNFRLVSLVAMKK